MLPNNIGALEPNKPSRKIFFTEDFSIAFANAEDDKVAITLYRATFNLATPDSEQVQKVQDAINAYRAANSLDQNGLIDDEMLNSLGL